MASFITELMERRQQEKNFEENIENLMLLLFKVCHKNKDLLQLQKDLLKLHERYTRP